MSGLSAAQLAMRNEGVGGSEVGSVLEINPFMSSEELARVKRGEVPPFEGNRHTKRGDFLEAGVFDWWLAEADCSGARVEKPGTLRHATLPHVFATPDRLVFLPELRGTLSVQIKVPSYFSGKKWGAEPPPYILAQVHYEMGVLASLGHTGLGGVVAAFIQDDKKAWPVTYDAGLSAELCERANSWFLEHVVGGGKR